MKSKMSAVINKVIKLKTRIQKIFSSNPDNGEIGSIKLNIWLAQITGVPAIDLKSESFGVQMAIIFYSACAIILVTFCYTGFEMYDLIVNCRDLNSITENICLSLTHVSGAVKIINLLRRLPDIRRIFENLKYVTKTFTKSQKQIEVFYQGEWENKIVLSFYFGIVGLTGLLGVAMMYISPESVARKNFPYRSDLPSWLPLQLQLSYMGLSVFLIAVQIVTVDYFNVNIINQIRFQLNILNLAFNDLIVDASVNPLQVKSLLLYKNEPLRRLNSIIEHHCLLRGIHQDTEDIFRQPVLLQFLTSVMIFGLTGFQATVTTGNSNVAIILYLYCVCIFSQLFVYCWFGNEVFEQSRTLATSGFNSSWYYFDRRYGKSLVIFLTNAQCPFVFTAGGFMTLSLPSFTGILSKSFSFIALLRQVYGR